MLQLYLITEDSIHLTLAPCASGIQFLPFSRKDHIPEPTGLPLFV